MQADGFFNFISTLASTIFISVIMAIIFLLNGFKQKIIRFLIFYVICIYINQLFKFLYSKPRPSWVDGSINKQCENGFGDPSGHA
jgi:hypothetical protein